MIELVGTILAIIGSVLGLIGAWYVSTDNRAAQHIGYTLWLWNSPMLIVSLIGIATGFWEGLTAWAFVPLNICYFYTAFRGWRNTR